MAHAQLIRTFHCGCITTGFFTLLFLFTFVDKPETQITQRNDDDKIVTTKQQSHSSPIIGEKFAVYSCTTPGKRETIYDYAFYLV